MTRVEHALVGAATVATVEALGPFHAMTVAAALVPVAVGVAAVDGWRRARARQRVGWRR